LIGISSAVAIGALLLLAAGVARAGRFLLPDPTSPVYATYAVVAGRDVQIIRDSTVNGRVHANRMLKVTKGGTVAGNASASVKLLITGTVTGTQTQGAPPITLPVLPTATAARALADRVLEASTILTDAVVDDVLFVAGNVRVRGSLRGTGTIIATGTIRIDTRSPTLPPIVDTTSRLALVAFQDVQIGGRQSFRGVAVAGRNILFKGDNRVEGIAVAAKDVKVKRRVTVPAVPVVDSMPPTISVTSPPYDAFIATARPTITATFADSGSGVDPSTMTFMFDTVDRTAAAQATATGVTFTPSAPLADGFHAAMIRVRDRAGHEAIGPIGFGVDTVPPVIAITGVPANPISDDGTIKTVVTFSDVTAGVDPETLVLRLDGTSQTAGCARNDADARCTVTGVPAGAHTLDASVRDFAGNESSATTTFTLVRDLAAPMLSVTAPIDGAVVTTAQVTVQGSVADDGSIARVTVNDAPVTVTGGSFSRPVTLLEGSNTIEVAAVDSTGKGASATLSVILDTTPPVTDDDPPVLKVTTPGDHALSNFPTARVAGTVTDPSGVTGVEVGGGGVPLTDDRFEATVALVDGPNMIPIRATDGAGNTAQATAAITYHSLPAVTIDTPADLAFLAATTATVGGTISDPAATVTVNGIAAPVANGRFTATDVPLVEGGNLVTAVARDVRGHESSATITAVRDLTAPRLAVEVPAEGTTVYTPTVVVAGLVNDLVAGTVNASDAHVTVNGVAATVANRSFAVTVPLELGDNTLDIVATDVGGNVGHLAHVVRREAPTVPHLAHVSGDDQSASIRSALPEPVVVAVLDAGGQPVPNVPVIFKVRSSNGTLDAGVRQRIVTSDANGQAETGFTLGSRAGPGSQRIDASAVGYGAPVSFRITAVPGPPARILADAGGLQWGVAGLMLPRPLVAVATDVGFNRLAGVAVRYTIAKGQGHFGDGTPERVVTTDSDGRAIVHMVLDPEEGIASTNATARIDGVDGVGPVTFVGTGLAATDPAQTSISGVVLDNTSEPIEGVTLRLRDHPELATTTNAEGFFRLAGVPVGSLYLIADGSTAARPGSWPDLEFVVTTIPGRDVTVGMPIYLLALNLADGIQIAENVGGRLALPAFPGFALDVAAGSVTFPSGSRTGMVSATVVHNDKVPMVPNFGQQPRFIVTIQPAGARFEPPARLTLPNVDGLTPGQVTEFYSFDHDLGHFVSIGPATVSEDGSVITSNPGVGIVKAGWHCGGDPDAAGTAEHCAECQKCMDGCCLPDDTDSPQQTSVTDCVAQRCRGGSVSDVAADNEVPPQRADNDCVRQVCRDKAVKDEEANEVPPQGPDDDCFREVCENKRVKRERTVAERPPPIEGNCQNEYCPATAHETRWSPDMNDHNAGEDCCGGSSGVPPEVYTVENECCVPDGDVLPKYPADPDRCTDRKPHDEPIECKDGRTEPGKPYCYQGCSMPLWLEAILRINKENPTGAPDTWFSNFGRDPHSVLTAPCDIHDECFQTCYPGGGIDDVYEDKCTQDWCDQLFAVCSASTQSTPDQREWCFTWARRYCAVVSSFFGGAAYDGNQEERCDCC
jgi:hypothetical protein